MSKIQNSDIKFSTTPACNLLGTPDLCYAQDGCTWINQSCQNAVCSSANCSPPGESENVITQNLSQNNNLKSNAGNVCDRANCDSSALESVGAPPPPPPPPASCDSGGKHDENPDHIWPAIATSLANIIGLGYLVDDPVTKGDEGKDPLGDAKADMQAVNAMGQIMSMQYQLKINDTLAQIMNTNQIIAQDSIILNNQALQSGVTQNKISILVANIVLFMIIIFLMFKK